MAGRPAGERDQRGEIGGLDGLDGLDDPGLGRGTPLPASVLPREWLEPSPWRGSLDAARIWLLVAAVLLVCGRTGALWATLVGIVVMGALQHHCSVLLHHAVHYNLHPRRSRNDTLARWALAAPIGQMLGSVRLDHLAHHRLFGSRRDPERFYWDLRVAGRTDRGGFVRWMLGIFSGGLVVPLLRRIATGSRVPERERRALGLVVEPEREGGGEDARDWIALVVVQGALFLGFWAIHGSPWAWPVLWALPLLTVGAGLNALRSTLEHAGGVAGEARFLSFQPGPVERFLLAPLGFEYHYEHHCFMAVPYYRAAALRRFLRERGDYPEGVLVGSYTAALRDLLGSLGRGPQGPPRA